MNEPRLKADAPIQGLQIKRKIGETLEVTATHSGTFLIQYTKLWNGGVVTLTFQGDKDIFIIHRPGWERKEISHDGK